MLELAAMRGGDTFQPLVYVDVSEVREGALEDLKVAIAELVDFIEANEPQLLAYNVYLSDDGSQMTVVHIHTSPDSLDCHMDGAGPAFRRFENLITLSSIRVYREPSDVALRQLREGTAARLGRDRAPVAGGLRSRGHARRYSGSVTWTSSSRTTLLPLSS